MNILFPEETSFMTRLTAINNPYSPIIKGDLLMKPTAQNEDKYSNIRKNKISLVEFDNLLDRLDGLE